MVYCVSLLSSKMNWLTLQPCVKHCSKVEGKREKGEWSCCWEVEDWHGVSRSYTQIRNGAKKFGAFAASSVLVSSNSAESSKEGSATDPVDCGDTATGVQSDPGEPASSLEIGLRQEEPTDDDSWLSSSAMTSVNLGSFEGVFIAANKGSISPKHSSSIDKFTMVIQGLHDT